jgi:hypothetical protein
MVIDSQTVERTGDSAVSGRRVQSALDEPTAVGASSKMKPTDEQQAILDFAKTGESFSVRAMAGAGKTSTLKAVAEQNPQKRMLYLAFNNSIAREAKSKFPSNVKVFTGHALAYHHTGKALAAQGRLVTSDFAIRTAMVDQFKPQLAAIGGDRREALTESAYVVFDTVKAFMNSGADEVSYDHVPADYKKQRPGQIVRTAQAVFDAMTDITGSTFPASHDAYLKAYTITHPKLTQYDVILGDEWQDTNRNMQGLLDGQTHAQKIYVGDSSQAIYGFRGAVDALSELDHLPSFPMTQSFRFGPQTAEIANAILAVKDETMQVKGLSSIEDHLLPARMPDVVLARTNAGLFQEAFAIIPQLDDGEKLAFVGGVKQVISMVTAAYDLYDKGETGHRDFRYFKTWADLVEVVKDGHAAEYGPFVRLVEQHGESIPEMCEALQAASTEDEKKARVVLSTAHTFKGREAPVVRIADDFPEICKYDEVRRKFTLNVEEANLAYVAVTRAQEILDASAYEPVLNSSLENRREMLGAQLHYGETEGRWSPERLEEQEGAIGRILVAIDKVGVAFRAEFAFLNEVAVSRAFSAADGRALPGVAQYDEKTRLGSIVADALAGPYRDLDADAKEAAREPRFLFNDAPAVIVDAEGGSYATVTHAYAAAAFKNLLAREQAAGDPDAVAMIDEQWAAGRAEIMRGLVAQKFEDPENARKLLVLDDSDISTFVARHFEAGAGALMDGPVDQRLGRPEVSIASGIDMAALFIGIRNNIQERVVERLHPDAGMVDQPAIDVEALKDTIEGTDWDAGAATARTTLDAVAAAAQIGPIAVGKLIEQFAVDAGASRDPEVAAIIGQLQGARDRGVVAGVERLWGSIIESPSSLPVYALKPTDIVSDRSAKKLVVDQTVTVEGRSEAGDTVYCRGKGDVIVAVTLEAFELEPQPGISVLLKRIGGKDVARPAGAELALANER